MIKYLREASDLHLDFDSRAFHALPKYHPDKLNRVPEHDRLWYPQPMPDDMETVLLLPGDLWYNNLAFERRFAGPESWIERVAKRFHSVVIIFGNHDYWDGSLDRAVPKAREHLVKYGITNVHILEQDSVIIDDVKFLGGTLWTDYNRGDPLVTYAAPNYMKNDFDDTMIGSGNLRRRLWPADLMKVHEATKKYIFSNARRDHPEQKVVVLTHHLPSYQSINPRYRTKSSETSNYFYYSALDYSFYEDEVEIDLWVHGHTHCACDYMIDRTRVLCNPRGYHGSESAEETGFNETLRLEVAQLKSVPPADIELPGDVPIIEELDDGESTTDSLV